MALSAVSTVVGKLADVGLKISLELYNVGDWIDPMKMELNLISGFLKDADAKQNKNPLVKVWVDELRDLAYRIEDALDTFLVDIDRMKPLRSGLMGKLKRAGKNPMKVNDLCGEIKKITELLKILYERGAQMGIKDIKEENHLIPTQFKPAKPSDIEDSEVVSLDTEKDQIISHLLDTTISRRTVLSIVGTGGLGKTTLAQKVYKSFQLEGKFKCRAWLSISQKFDKNNILRQILYSIEPRKKYQEPPIADDDLPNELKSSLSGQRYLIILDDVWTIDLWAQLKTALPDLGNGSRVLITTRKVDVAKAADCNTKPFELRYLNHDESLLLLFRNALQQKIQPDEYRPDLKNIAERLIRKCDGLPLALIVIGGILSKRSRNSTAWQEVENTLDWHNKDGENCSKILALSYEDLPYELKPCFLYFASFPEDYEINANHITKMWVAEGFIPKDGAGTMENRAKVCLAELVQRCLVQVNKKSSSSQSKTCKIHDLLRDLAINEAKSGNFLTVFSEVDPQNYGRADTTLTSRRATLQFCTSIEYDLLSSKTRSLICFGKHKLNCQGFRLLRVLNFERNKGNENYTAKQDIHQGYFNSLIHLRFLGFRYCENFLGFQNINFSYFKNFETLDVTGTTNLGIPLAYGAANEPNESLWEVPTLRNVISTSPILGPSQWDHLKNVQTLKWVKFKKVPVLVNNISLRKIGVSIEVDSRLRKYPSQPWYKNRTHVKGGGDPNNTPLVGSMEQQNNVWHILKGLLQRTPSLTSLSLRALDRQQFGVNVTCDLTFHKKLQKLHLFGWWTIALNIEMLPKTLVKFTLIISGLKEDPMPVLERLQSLRILQLLESSYMGTKMICSAGGFPSLQKLKLYNLAELSEWEIKEGAMRNLNHLTISACNSLDMLPELQSIPSLQELVVAAPSVELKRRILSEDQYKIENIPIVRIY